MSTNNLTIVWQLRCSERGCGQPVRLVGTEKRYGFPQYVFAHEGEPCRRYYGKDPETHEGFPVDRPEPIRRCAACWPYETRTEVGEHPDADGRGIVTTRQEAWGDRTTCATCTRENYYSIGD
ncbi:hypothetical protein SEA_JUSTBECAUSE_333 [Streptomyces phage JustBecause]|jgi:hypothetical protein|nr:hypothetical protein SEA_JUSTBECAUSE_333 [Streptomyces phage JustBecause]